MIAEMFGGTDESDDSNRRPDLLLLNRYMGRYLLIEFKRPSSTLDWLTRIRLKRYRAKLKPTLIRWTLLSLGENAALIWIIHDGGRIRMTTYTELISRAASELEWLLSELKRDAQDGKRYLQ